MANQTGTSTDYKDLMIDFNTFITANGWTAVRDTTDSPLPGTLEMIFRGHGDSSPEKEIFFGLESYEDSGTGYYNWRVRGFTGFSAGSPEGSVLFADQPGASPLCYVPLLNGSMDYWFYATGRVAIMVVKTGTSFQFMYCGFLDVFATDSEWPYPMMVMGSTHDSTRVYSSNAIDYSSSINPGGNSDSTADTNNSAAYLRSVDGSWYPVKNIYNASGNETQVGEGCFHVDPLKSYVQGNFAAENKMNTASTFNALFYKNSQGGAPIADLRLADDGGSGTRMIVPLVVWMSDPTKMIVGEIHGVFWTSGADGLTAEDTITDDSVSPQDTYTAFQNIHRTDNWCFLAVKDI